MNYLNRIEINPKIMMGKPVIKGTRIPIYVILKLLGEGYSFEKIFKEYPDLTQQDILAVLKYAAKVLHFEEIEKKVRA